MNKNRTKNVLAVVAFLIMGTLLLASVVLAPPQPASDCPILYDCTITPAWGSEIGELYLAGAVIAMLVGVALRTSRSRPR